MEASRDVQALVLQALKSFSKHQSMGDSWQALLEVPEFRYVFCGDANCEFAHFYVEIEDLARAQTLQRHADILYSIEHFRLSVYEYAMLLAVAAATRCEDPKRKVGAVALTKENRVVATSYNGLPRGVDYDLSWWDSDKNRRQFVIHAESNLCSLTQRGDVETVAVTTMPCGPCARDLVAHGISRVIFGGYYPTDTSGEEIFEKFGVETILINAKDTAKTLVNVLNHI